MPTLPGEHHADICIRRSIVEAVEGVLDLPNMLLGDGNRDLPIHMRTEALADGRFGKLLQRL
jgi:hypothetical protein